MELSSKVVLPNCSHAMCINCYRQWWEPGSFVIFFFMLCSARARQVLLTVNSKVAFLKTSFCCVIKCSPVATHQCGAFLYKGLYTK
jgi:hypothetical protein